MLDEIVLFGVVADCLLMKTHDRHNSCQNIRAGRLSTMLGVVMALDSVVGSYWSRSGEEMPGFRCRCGILGCPDGSLPERRHSLYLWQGRLLCLEGTYGTDSGRSKAVR